jgi:aryl-alcohol dehydrogenase-like predicted oxidoreductase
MAQFALRWILMEDSVSTVIPGARNAQQAAANNSASSLLALPLETMDALRLIYQQRIAPFVHQRW